MEKKPRRIIARVTVLMVGIITGLILFALRLHRIRYLPDIGVAIVVSAFGQLLMPAVTSWMIFIYSKNFTLKGWTTGLLFGLSDGAFAMVLCNITTAFIIEGRIPNIDAISYALVVGFLVVSVAQVILVTRKRHADNNS